MNWREFITDTFESSPQMPCVAARPKFYPGASAHEIAKAAARLNADLPASLRSVLRESNGVMEMIKIDGGRWHNGGWVLWTVREIVKCSAFRSSKMLFVRPASWFGTPSKMSGNKSRPCSERSSKDG